MSKATAAREAFAGLSDVARRWYLSLQKPLGWALTRETLFPGKVPVLANEELREIISSPKFLEKLKNFGEEFPEGLRQYDYPSLISALDETAKGNIDLALIDPKDFRMLANRGLERWLPPEGNLDPNDPVTLEIIEKINHYADMYEHGIQFDAIPHLYGTKPIDDRIIKMTGHQGRHRMRAQEKLGANTALVKIAPTPHLQQIRASEVDPGTLLQPEPYFTDPASRFRLDAPPVTPGPYKSIADVLKFLSLGGFSFGALKDLADE
jgi:hypothetical protein